MEIFRFKKFSVRNERSAMKVNTDGVLLGAVMGICPCDRAFLDVGTGTGTIALMAAQRCEEMHSGDADVMDDIRIDAIDIDMDSAAEAGINFASSPWSGILHSYNESLETFAGLSSVKYDLIFSNPPYFDSSLAAPQSRRNDARHTSGGLSYRELSEFAAERLSCGGRLAIVLPADQERALLRHAGMCGLFPQRITRVRTVHRKPPGRIIVEFSLTGCTGPEEMEVTIQDEGKYTPGYISLTRDFYIQF